MTSTGRMMPGDFHEIERRCNPNQELMMLEILHRPLVFLRGLPGIERAEVAAFAGPGVLLAGGKSVFS